ncbi:MAG: hypothetical protein HQL50_04995, partial [Magnetococcales bacterium]|nr:hypothetical protein [Magnetococcales bacterium]
TILVTDTIGLTDATISTSANGGSGSGGNIFIDPIVFYMKGGTSITADAVGGAGGGITIVAQNFFQYPGSTISASSAFGLSGTVDLDTPDSTVADSLEAMPDKVFDATALMRERCSTRGGGGGSHFVISGRGGMPTTPGDLRASSSAPVGLAGGMGSGGVLRVSGGSGGGGGGMVASVPVLQTGCAL